MFKCDYFKSVVYNICLPTCLKYVSIGKETLICFHEIWEFTYVSMAYSLKLHINTFFPHGADVNYLQIFFPS